MRKLIRGVTLIELIIVITLVGIVGVMVSTIIGNQMYGYVEMSRRAALVQLADLAVKKIARDIREAVPNSIRVSGTALEMVPIVYAARYRSEHSDDAGTDTLDFTTTDSSFDVFANLVTADTTMSGGQAIIYNIGLVNAGTPVSGANLYANHSGVSPHVISRAGLTITNDGVEDLVELDTGHQFRFKSPEQRVYIVNGALSYVCDIGTGNINRFHGYAISASQSTSPGGTSSLLADNVSACSFTYSAGTLSRNGVVTIQLTLSDGDQSITLLEQVHVSNSP